jgi:hypothetical protein
MVLLPLFMQGATNTRDLGLKAYLLAFRTSIKSS